jgi:hypothetical protein
MYALRRQVMELNRQTVVFLELSKQNVRLGLVVIIPGCMYRSFASTGTGRAPNERKMMLWWGLNEGRGRIGVGSMSTIRRRARTRRDGDRRGQEIVQGRAQGQEAVQEENPILELRRRTCKDVKHRASA